MHLWIPIFCSTNFHVWYVKRLAKDCDGHTYYHYQTIRCRIWHRRKFLIFDICMLANGVWFCSDVNVPGSKWSRNTSLLDHAQKDILAWFEEGNLSEAFRFFCLLFTGFVSRYVYVKERACANFGYFISWNCRKKTRISLWNWKLVIQTGNEWSFMVKTAKNHDLQF